MSQTAWLVALSAVAVVSAILSFVAWSLLARPQGSLPPAAESEDADAEEQDETAETEETDDEAAEHEEEDPDAG
jgi:ribosomal protein L12E/L44/L45/RPP1/RPP2